ncbi:MAG: phosphotransferase [Phycisphaerales bacterium]|nr:phosphotransferase [Phycisphaerales bacterium]
MGPVTIPLAILGGLLAIVVGATLLLYIIVPVFKGIGFIIRQLFNFIVGEVSDTFRIIGAVITGLLFVPMTIGNIVIGRWSAAAHFGRAIKSECSNVLLSVYRIVIGHPARLLCLNSLTDGLERRLPAVVAAAPGADLPGRKTGRFPGYEIVGSLPGGGSGGRLYVAEPDETKLAVFARAGVREVRQVVIKSFSIHDGSSLPQIVRESRSLDAAKKLGLVLDHELTNERFFYVMKYMPGQGLGLVTQQLHAASPESGLADQPLRAAMGYAADLLRTLQTYHAGGLWHKDVKPDNIIVDGREAHLVDFGLVTPLRSAMTLTTHGTEYFRDPEMVRLALRGVKVHEVDGAKFDLYAAGAVMYSMIENSFPAHGVLSPIHKRCPEALRWIVRRAMSDYDKRYTSAGQMLADLDVVRMSRDPFAVKPIELPSMRSAGVGAGQEDSEAAVHAANRDAGEFAPGLGRAAGVVGAGVVGAGAVGAGMAGAAAGVARPKIRLVNWWTGGYAVDQAEAARAEAARAEAARAEAPADFMRAVDAAALRTIPKGARRSAAEQLERARTRAAAVRLRAQERRSSRRSAARRDFNTAPNAGVILASMLFLGLVIAGVASFAWRSSNSGRAARMSVPVEVSPDGSMTTIRLGGLKMVTDHATGETTVGPADAPAVPESPEGFRIEDRRVGVPTPPKAPQAPRPVIAVSKEPRGVVLFVNDFRSPVPEAVGELAGAAVRSLAEHGLLAMGDLTPVEGERDAKEVELIAGLRAAMGLTPLDSEDAGSRIAEWLKGAGGEVRAVVWFSPAPGGAGGEPTVRLVGPLKSAEFDEDDIEQIREALSEDLSAVGAE